MTITALAAGSVADRRASLESVVEQLGADDAQHELTRTLHHEAIRAIADTGVLALRIPQEYGGPGGSIVDVIETVIDIAQASSNVAQALRAHFGFVERLLGNRGDDALRARWFPDVLSGKIVGNAITEAVGASPAAIGTTLRATGDGRYRLDGKKFYSTGTLYADLIAVSAEREDGREVHVIIPADRQGVTLFDDWDGFGQRLTASGATTFESVVVHKDEVSLVPADHRLAHSQTFLQLYLTAVAVGIAKGALRDAIGFVQNKARPAAHALTASATQDPFILQAVGEIAAWTSTATAVTLGAAAALDRVVDSGQIDDQQAIGAAAIEVAKAQLVAERLTLDAAQRLFDTGGASATARTLNLDRHWRNARTIASHNPLAYKAWATGDFLVNGALPPNSGYF
ncbi:acyl-CoA dehydrogenase [Mycolicibacterium sp. TY66]|uniref:acyl-CoA dehydrogenase family protein n=1 Tax=Mycobacteriaceae TaxID=1762 RepID=UPI001BB42DA3|nr:MULTISPECIES: acyl-CoA dehydrogenase family protein [unclassified Mycolicibacterium]BCI78866.1 acyl-CoA dehydrogenase [Mycolicibacterium sp. TY66]BCJ83473.1 acyl-CoA dehydrogenase [Mycolicibacterium sp. TY81]